MQTALIIDDSRQNADTLCEMINFLGLKALPCYGPRAAMLALSRIVPNIIFLDINMPGVDGFEIMAYIRRLPQLQETPVVFVTSDDQKETARRVRQTGALRLILKPASIEAVEKVLRDAGMI